MDPGGFQVALADILAEGDDHDPFLDDLQLPAVSLPPVKQSVNVPVNSVANASMSPVSLPAMYGSPQGLPPQSQVAPPSSSAMTSSFPFTAGGTTKPLAKDHKQSPYPKTRTIIPDDFAETEEIEPEELSNVDIDSKIAELTKGGEAALNAYRVVIPQSGTETQPSSVVVSQSSIASSINMDDFKIATPDLSAFSEEAILTEVMAETNSDTLLLDERYQQSGARSQHRFEPMSVLNTVRLNKKRLSQGVLHVEDSTRVTNALKDLRGTAGLPTTFAIQGSIVAIGTTQGNVIMIDILESPKLKTTVLKTSLEHGAVSSLDISLSQSWVVCGHKLGVIVLWDYSSNYVLKIVKDAHASQPILHTKFLFDRVRVISGDKKGKVNVITFSWGLLGYSYYVEPLLSGDHGQVLALSVLLPVGGLSSDRDATSGQSLVAISTYDMTLIISLHPEARVIFKILPPNHIPDSVVPCHAWRRSGYCGRAGGGKQKGPDKVLNPILIVAWGTDIQLLQVMPSAIETWSLEFISIGRISTDCDVTAIDWLGEQVVVFLNSKNELRVLDPFALEEVESLNVKSTELVYHTELSSKRTGKPILIFHSSMGSSGGRAYLLGLNRVCCASVLSWDDRIGALVDAGEWLEALVLALDFYEGQATAVVGLPRNLHALREVLKPQVKNLLLNYMDVAIAESGGISSLTSNKQCLRIVAICIEYCSSICAGDLNFGNDLLGYVHSKFASAGAGFGSMFLEMLEPYMISSKLTQINPAVMQAFVDQYRDKQMLDRLEKCILHMEMTNLDFHQVITLCRKHSLYRALIYVYNKGLNDFVTPLEELVLVVNTVQSKLSKLEQSLNKIVTSDSNNSISKSDSSSATNNINGDSSNIDLNNSNNNNSNDNNNKLNDSNNSNTINVNNSSTISAISINGSDSINNLNSISSVTANTSDNINIGTTSTALTATTATLTVSSSTSNSLMSPSSNVNSSSTVVSSAALSQHEALLEGKSKLSLLLIEYLKCCLGTDVASIVSLKPNAYNVVIGPERFLSVRKEILEFLFMWSPIDSQKPYQRLSCMLWLDTVGFLNVLSVSMNLRVDLIIKEIELGKKNDSRKHRLHSVDGSLSTNKQQTPEVETTQTLALQTIVDILVSVIIDPSHEGWIPLDTKRPSKYKWQFLLSQQGHFLMFLAEFILQRSVSVSAGLFNRVVAYLAVGVPAFDPSTAIVREKLLLALLKLDSSEKEGLCDVERLLPLAEQSNFNKVCIFLFKKVNDYNKVIHHYLEDNDLRSEVFTYINTLLKDTQLPEKKQEVVRMATLSYLRLLIKIDSDKAADLIISDFAQEHSVVLKELEPYPELQYQYLTGIIKSAAKRANSIAVEGTGLELTEHMHELYVKLLCRFNPDGVYSYLSSHDEYRLDYCLKLCREYHIIEAEAFLLERMGDISGALDLMLKTMDDQIIKLRTVFDNNPTSRNVEEVVSDEALLAYDTSSLPLLYAETHDLQKSLLVAINLCRRARRLDENESEDLWFKLLDRFVHPQRQLREEQKKFLPSTSVTVQNSCIKMQKVLTSIIRTVLYNMMGRVPLASILKRLVLKNGSEEFGELKSVIFGVLDNFVYERNILSCCSRLLSHDLYCSVEQLYHERCAALRPRELACAVCLQGFVTKDTGKGVIRFLSESSTVLVFDCGHLFHKACLLRARVCPLCDSEEQKSRRRADDDGLGSSNSTNNTPLIPSSTTGNSNTTTVRRLANVSLPASSPSTLPTTHSEQMDATKRYIKRLEWAERRSRKSSVSRHDIWKALGQIPFDNQ